jgi:hypothetical protein
MQFFRDRRQSLIKMMVEDWEVGRLTIAQEQEVRGRALEAADIAGMEFAAMEEFYNGDEDTGPSPD